ncbi:asparaginase [Oharaeibacter diazotrophicus]|uniref:Asparaginase n=1 Tax=Oharaeibacter diazotrophicus TaxID=1920512 RepID=A0A4R6RIY7_9HYPH|nr:asparaginase [Oharaeibacter diazotrophicus]TDP86400.1 asparaginase [Oharaeibacter diazotrophicus]BBE71657.1 L-asparaginase II [Pleomorphomonas sp. SM30]GLS78422.1 asparaginase [Oharaeibacter diazotrophicus]
MANPVLVDVTRGDVVESRHRGAIAVMDAAGRTVFAVGDVERPAFPRSAVKAFQALPLMESGAADRFGFGDRELALAVSSHNGEEGHVAMARSMLAKAGLDEGCLACGAHWPQREADKARLHRMGAPAGRIHNNCSGKHAGFLCAAVQMGVDPAGYNRPDHPLMREVVAAVEAMTGAAHGADVCGTDGCSIPTFAIPIAAMARGFARFVTGEGLSPERARACTRLRDAAMAEPFMVAGTGRFCTDAMAALGGRTFVKTGAEGVFTAAIPGRGLGLAVKIDDGAARASEAVTAALLIELLGLDADDPARATLDRLAAPEIRSWAGELCGGLRVAADLSAARPD